MELTQILALIGVIICLLYALNRNRKEKEALEDGD